jgi:hypothetical protein
VVSAAGGYHGLVGTDDFPRPRRLRHGGVAPLFTSVAASRFKEDIKRWRLFADIMVDIGITLEVAAAQVPAELLLPVICVGNMCKAVCGVAAGACGDAINYIGAPGQIYPMSTPS